MKRRIERSSLLGVAGQTRDTTGAENVLWLFAGDNTECNSPQRCPCNFTS